MLNLNKFEYSYANTLGCHLKFPLRKLTSNIAAAHMGKIWESQALRVAKLAFHCFIALICIIPAGMAWLTGKVFIHFSATQLDYEKLPLAPPPLKTPDLSLIEDTINLSDLVEKFKNLFSPKDEDPKLLSLERLCQWITAKNPKIYPESPRKRALFCGELSSYLKAIILKLRSDDLIAEKKKEILLELAEASSRCYPTWLEVAAQTYYELYGGGETVEVKILQMVQGYKEKLILEFTQEEYGTEWHTVNYVRNILGRELGLNTVLNKFDLYADFQDETFGRRLTKWLFLQEYDNVNRLISSLVAQIKAKNSKDFDNSYYLALKQFFSDLKIPSPDDFIQEHFFDEQSQINHLGINVLLRQIGVVR